jgi:hypothetical protein
MGIGWNTEAPLGFAKLLILGVAVISAPPCAICAGSAASGWADSGFAQEAIPAAVAREHGFPVPRAARRNESLGGATSVAPGKNYTVIVYDVDSGIEAMTTFYAYHLPEAKRVAEGREVKFSTPAGHVRLARIGKSTRITLAIGPR